MPDPRVTKTQRQEIITRAQECCEYCHSQARFATQSFTVEHIIPRYAGGTTTLDNLAWSCFGCNSHKHTKTVALDPFTRQIVALFHPRQQNWHDHFAWNEDFTFIIGTTPIGCATIEALQLNRPELVNLRRVLHMVGEHPLPVDR